MAKMRVASDAFSCVVRRKKSPGPERSGARDGLCQTCARIGFASTSSNATSLRGAEGDKAIRCFQCAIELDCFASVADGLSGKGAVSRRWNQAGVKQATGWPSDAFFQTSFTFWPIFTFLKSVSTMLLITVTPSSSVT